MSPTVSIFLIGMLTPCSYVILEGVYLHAPREQSPHDQLLCLALAHLSNMSQPNKAHETVMQSLGHNAKKNVQLATQLYQIIHKL